MMLAPHTIEIHPERGSATLYDSNGEPVAEYCDRQLVELCSTILTADDVRIMLREKMLEEGLMKKVGDKFLRRDSAQY